MLFCSLFIDSAGVFFRTLNFVVWGNVLFGVSYSDTAEPRRTQKTYAANTEPVLSLEKHGT